MSFYVVSVQPRREKTFVALAREALARAHGIGTHSDATDRTGGVLPSLHWPQRKLTIRKGGKRQETLAPIFPGYIFVEADRIDEITFAIIKKLPGFYRFLERNDRIRALSGDDRELVAHFVRFGDVIGKSTVTFDEKARIQVKDGPLAGLEGRIVKVDRRKRRAKVRLDLYKESFLVDFGFELLKPASSADAKR